MRKGWLVWALGAVLLAGVGAALTWAVGRDGEGTARRDLGEPREGGTLRLAVVNLQSLDPARSGDAASLMAADLLFESLVSYDPKTLEAAPGIAESWDVSVDQRRFTFTIREGLVFHDGSAVDANDVRASLQRVAAPDTQSALAPLLSLVTGYAAFHDDKTADKLAGLKVVDDRRLTIELTQPFSHLPLVLGNPGLGILPSERATDPAFGDAPVGSGPLRFDERQGDVITMTRFEEYAPGATWVEAIEVHVVANPEAAFALLRDGDVDVSPVPPDQVGRAAALYGEAGFTPVMATVFYGMNLASPVFEDVRLRQAIVHAVDRDRIIGLVYGDAARVADGLLAPAVPEFVDDACGDRCEYDPDRATALVREAFPDGKVPEVNIDFDDDGRQRTVASAIQSDLQAVGIPAKLRPHEFKDYLPFLVNGDPQLFRFGWTADYPSADDLLYRYFVTDQVDNLTHFSVREVDQKLRSARAEKDPAKRSERYREAEQMLLDRLPVLPIAQFTNRWAAGPDVGGFEMTPNGTLSVTNLFLARPSRSKA
ncbi:MAG: ABC transporter substrate-binding protein [Actinobacteria bacterium]|nr:ABC transporter substrate-binding protein [Actinomycetota bacterium]